jgi:hypothetical protein
MSNTQIYIIGGVERDNVYGWSDAVDVVDVNTSEICINVCICSSIYTLRKIILF